MFEITSAYFLARKFKYILLIFSSSTCRTFVTGGLEKVRKGVKVMVCKIRKKVTSTARLPPQCLKNLKKSHFFNIHQSHAFQKNIWIFCAQNQEMSFQMRHFWWFWNAVQLQKKKYAAVRRLLFWVPTTQWSNLEYSAKILFSLSGYFYLFSLSLYAFGDANCPVSWHLSCGFLLCLCVKLFQQMFET